jgi:hypothetical protein
MAKAINPAMRLYSIAVAPDSSRRNCPNISFSLEKSNEIGVARPSCHRDNQNRKIARFIGAATKADGVI